LIGEAATYEAAGESIVLDPSLWADAREAQEQRRAADPWEDILACMPNSIIHKSDDGFERVASAEILKQVLEIPAAQQNPAHWQRLAHVMKHIGWGRNDGGRVTINGTPVRGYIRPSCVPIGPACTNGAACTGTPTGATGNSAGSAGIIAASPAPRDAFAFAAARAQADLEIVRSTTDLTD
jgi:hypothetical protein